MIVTNDELWEPLWQVGVSLHPAEKEIIASEWFERLASIHHAGAICLVSEHTYNRQEHTLGVFALVAALEPDNLELRVASLLHDLGHYPFSHTLESIDGINHHVTTGEIIDGEWLAHIIEQYGLDEDTIRNYLSGRCASPLKNQADIMQLDHLDSWVRSASACMELPFAAPDIRRQLRVVDGYVEMSRDAADHITALIFEGAEFHCSTANLAANAILSNLVEQLMRAGEIGAKQLFEMTEEHILTKLLENERTAGTLRKLLESPQLLSSARTRESVGAGDMFEMHVPKLYLSLPLVAGKRIDEWSGEIADRLSDAKRKLGSYYIYFEQ